jgi:iron-sulfur cluster assembly protein
MLAISESAAEAIRGLGDGPQAPEGAGLRIVARTGEGEDDVALELSLTATPAEEDEAVEGRGPQVFLDPGAADLLYDKRLEAQVDGSRVTFGISDQAA